MSDKMTEGSGEVEDESIDLNKEPVDNKKRKREEQTSDTIDKGDAGSDSLSKSGRVLRPRTAAMSNGGKQLNEMELENSEDTDENQVHMTESENESEKPVSRRRKKKGKRGRPRKTESKIVVPKLNIQKRAKRGRPPKNESKFEVTSSSNSKEDDKKMDLKKMDESSDGGAGPGRERPKVKGKRGRPRKIENENMGLGVKKKIVKKSSNNRKKQGTCGAVKKLKDSTNETVLRKKKGTVDFAERKEMGHQEQDQLMEDQLVAKVSSNDIGDSVRRKEKRSVEFAEGKDMGHKEQNQLVKDELVAKVITDELGNVVMKQKKGKVKRPEGEMGLRERKQLVRDQIVEMITKAGWTVEYRQRQSKDYQDAVYVDRERRTYWSTTLAYKKLKERVESGEAEEIDILAFTPIPEETFSMLFRITEKGKKTGKKKNIAGRTIKTKTKKETVKSKSSEGRVKSRPRTLLARKHRVGSGSGDNNSYEGNRNLLSWMIDLGNVPLGGKVKFRRGRGRKILIGGKIVKEGICCDCCNITHGIREFECHAECTPGNPYEDIYLESGTSLFQCLVNSWKKHVKKDEIKFVHVDVEGDDPNDDTCNVCGDGGDLICCDSCPSTFHHGCLNIKVPSGDWYCVYCSCKFCGMACESTSNSDDEDSDLSADLSACHLCEEKYHVHCVEGTITEDFDHGNRSFCGKECFEIYEQLQALLGVKHDLEEGFSYTILHHVVSGDASLNSDSPNVENNAKLAVAFSVMDECFVPIIDERSGTNMIHSVVYNCGSNIRRLSYDGFYTIMLEKGDEAIAAASIRIHGSKLAEMPFIGTRFMYRRQGMCSKLLTSIEKVLGSLGVEKLVIPAISELNETWTNVFGFCPLEETTSQEMRQMSMIVFPGVDMLQKPLVGHQSIKAETDSAVTEGIEVRPEHQIKQENAKSATQSTEDQICSENIKEEQIEDIGDVAEQNIGISWDIEIHNNEKMAVVESGDAAEPVGLSDEADTKIDGVDVNKSCENGDCVSHLDASKDNDIRSEINITIDCNVEPKQSADETDTCPNGFLSENRGTGKCVVYF